MAQFDDVPRALALPAATVKKRTRLPSLIWAIPIVAALAGAFILVQSWLSAGPTIHLAFKTADGIEAGKTHIRYKDVDIGTITKVELGKDNSGIVATAEIVKSASDMLVDDTRFWVVRPRISGGSVSGLGTLLSGAYIGLDIGKSHQAKRDFTGLETQPVISSDLPGKQFVLHGTERGSADVGSPIYFRHFDVGQIESYEMDPGGRGVTMHVFIRSPYDVDVTANTRFWNASGVDVAFGANGLKVNTESLVSLIEGGLAFQSPDDDTSAPAAAGATFTVFADRETAMKPNDGPPRKFLVYFRQSLRGLSTGAPVELHGIALGEVTSIGLEYDKDAGIFKFPVEFKVFPDRLNARYRAGSEHVLSNDAASDKTIVDKLVAGGMRAELISGSLITGQQLISLDFHPNAPKAQINWDQPTPVMPSLDGGLTQITDAVGHVAANLAKVPFDQIAAQLVTTMKNLDTTLANSTRLVQRLNGDVAPEVTSMLVAARGAMTSAQKTLSSESPLQQNASDAMKQIANAAQRLSELADYLERHPESLIRGKQGDPK